MIKGAHILFYSKNPEADRAFFRDVLEFRHRHRPRLADFRAAAGGGRGASWQRRVFGAPRHTK